MERELCDLVFFCNHSKYLVRFTLTNFTFVYSILNNYFCVYHVEYEYFCTWTNLELSFVNLLSQTLNGRSLVHWIGPFFYIEN